MPNHCKNCRARVARGWHYCSDRCLIIHRRIIVGDCWEWVGAVKGEPPNHYGRTTTRRNGKKISRLAHRVSYEAFKGPILHNLNVLHQCHNPQCVNPEHLQIGTQKENLEQAKARGTRESFRYAKLTPAQIKTIRARAFKYEAKELADRFGVSLNTIYRVRRGNTWKDIT
jgi:HNH endonuclease